MLFFDTETTGLEKPAQPVELQPRIIEIGIIRVNDGGLELGRFHSLVNPGIILEPIITEITGITDADLANAPSFARVVNSLIDFCRGEYTWVAHNVEFDRAMLVYELRRMGWEHRFPYPQTWVDSLTWSNGLSLEKWSKHLFEEGLPAQKHRAIDDVELLISCWMKHNEQNQAARTC